jgi:hypothetical protein
MHCTHTYIHIMRTHTQHIQGVSDLTTLTQILSATFGDFCPVYDKHLGKFKESSEVSSSNKASDQYRATPEFSKQQKPSSFGGV